MFLVFQLFRTYVVSVLSGCCKNRSGVAHVAMGPTCHWGTVWVTVMHLWRASTGGHVDCCVHEMEQAWAGPTYARKWSQRGTGNGAALVAWETEQRGVVCACVSKSLVCADWDWEERPDVSCGRVLAASNVKHVLFWYCILR